MQPIEPTQSLMEVTTDRIRTAIISGELPLGSKLSEQRLADTLKISRSPVREALAMLQQEGLVEVIAKVGSFVFTPDIESALDLCDHRAILESACIRMAIERNHQSLVAGLFAGAADMQSAIENDDPVAYVAGDMRFHNSIITCGGNRSIARAYPHTIGPLMALRTHLFTVMNMDLDNSMSEHEAMIRACQDKDIDGAIMLVKDHISHLVEAYQLSQSGDTPPVSEPASI